MNILTAISMLRPQLEAIKVKFTTGEYHDPVVISVYDSKKKYTTAITSDTEINLFDLIDIEQVV